MELDYKKMFEESQQRLSEMFALQNEFCELAAYIQENGGKVKIASENLMKMSMTDQVAVFRSTAATTRICVALYDKYNMCTYGSGEKEADSE